MLRTLAKAPLHIVRQNSGWIRVLAQKRLAKRGWQHRALDMGAIILILGAIIAFLWYRWNDLGRFLVVNTAVAPAQVEAGGNATVNVQYTYTGTKPLGEVRFTLLTPPHFILQGIDHPNFQSQTTTIELGDIAPGARGQWKVRGILFGNVGDQQQIDLQATYTQDNSTHTRTFSVPISIQASALHTNLVLPERVVSGQRIQGDVVITNAGGARFPSATILPTFPAGFHLEQSSIPRDRKGTWHIAALDVDEEVRVHFVGTLPQQDQEQVLFRFTPSFSFGDESFIQKSTEKIVAILPSPFLVQLQIPEGPMSTMGVDGTLDIKTMEGADVVQASLTVLGSTLAPISLNATALQKVSVRLVPTATGINRLAHFIPEVRFTLKDQPQETLTARGAVVERRLITPLSLTQHAYYFTADGDQLGRGPLPPRVGSITTYWIHWELAKSFNTLTGVEVRATLPTGVQFSGAQSVGRGSKITQEGREIVWRISELEPTLTDSASANFAVSMTPTSAQIGTTPSLLGPAHVSALDGWTDVRVNASSAGVSAKIEGDAGRVE